VVVHGIASAGERIVKASAHLIVDLREVLRLESRLQLGPNLLTLAVVGADLFCDVFDTLAFRVCGIRKLPTNILSSIDTTSWEATGKSGSRNTALAQASASVARWTPVRRALLTIGAPSGPSWTAITSDG
jgi:hypothetical protein